MYLRSSNLKGVLCKNDFSRHIWTAKDRWSNGTQFARAQFPDFLNTSELSDTIVVSTIHPHGDSLGFEFSHYSFTDNDFVARYKLQGIRSDGGMVDKDTFRSDGIRVGVGILEVKAVLDVNAGHDSVDFLDSLTIIGRDETGALDFIDLDAQY